MLHAPDTLYGMNEDGEMFKGDELLQRTDIIAVTTEPGELSRKIKLVDVCGEEADPDEFAVPVFGGCQYGEKISFVIRGIRLIKNVIFDGCYAPKDRIMPRAIAEIFRRSGYADTHVFLKFFRALSSSQCWVDPCYAIEFDDVRDLIVVQKD